MTTTAADKLVPLLYRYGRCQLEKSSENPDLWNVWVEIPNAKLGGRVGESARVCRWDVTFEEAKEWAVVADAKATQLWKALDDLLAAAQREADALSPPPPDPF